LPATASLHEKLYCHIKAAGTRCAIMFRHLARLPRILLFLTLLVGLAQATVAQEGSPRDVALDRLFAELREAPDQAAAQPLVNQIWILWLTPDDPELRAFMGAVQAARIAGDIPAAMTLLDRIVVDYPDYAEGWNQRATLFYMVGDFDSSIADCAKVLSLEPRHFGALSGRALMYLAQGKRALALKDISSALQLHPFLNERMLFPELTQDMTRI
jgi:tetratricopeptide (TPR) repeat protein